jgi:hypothetical protein
MREGRSRPPVEPRWRRLRALSLGLALSGIVLLVIGTLDNFSGGLSGERPDPTAFVAAAVCGFASFLAGVVGWVKTSGRDVVRAWPLAAGVIGGLVVFAGVRGAYENSRPPAACRDWDVAGSAPATNALNGVAATSASNAWAVGRCSAGSPDKTLILHWDGSSWERQPSPNVGWGINVLRGVAASSASEAWAVGGYAPEGGTNYNVLIARWDGVRWTRQPSPVDGEPAELAGVALTSSSNAWAVGWSNSGAVILHWDGSMWTDQAPPDLGAGVYPYLLGVAATSDRDAWAVGRYGGWTEDPVRAVVFHWNGTAWTNLAVPRVGAGDNILNAVSAASPTDVWAVGSYEHGTGTRALILHWDGEAWTRDRLPDPRSGSYESLTGVAAASPNTIWAVGVRHQDAIVLCWNGSTWEERPGPDVGTGANLLNGVGTSASSAWAVGLGGDGTAARMQLPSCPSPT